MGSGRPRQRTSPALGKHGPPCLVRFVARTKNPSPGKGRSKPASPDDPQAPAAASPGDSARSGGAKAAASDPLAGPMAVFAAGDYPEARAGFEAVLAAEGMSDATRAAAAELAASTRIDRVTLLAGLACVGLFGVAAAFTAWIQP